MNAKELKAILQALMEHEVSEMSLETPDYKLNIKRGNSPAQVQYVPAPVATPQVTAPQPAVPAPQPAAAAAPATTPHPAVAGREAEDKKEEIKGVEVKAPIVGTFYRAPAPDAEPYVKEGDSVKKGQVLCIIEAMKLMNEIESEVSGVVRKILVNDAEPVEYGQTLFIIEPA
ncbi:MULTISPECIES: acetyl-CoA carboxylase biotin carboxyl carrier protein [unclassified Meiothermus]|uniref:acetyl-CoA carboxylase biotin carboxyl carrier protein n=1 Tax=unclassified Meiothermus TaxID=370471 RepID=UPI000D7BCAB8|nr:MULTISPECIES: acetyl-CoA carboxylase biotin carboxyl carrier protein [unclassified Meiothermus]PZA06948.1 acetyl-CoA carboxylase, biotin carboxyl carrier protein [Meiothermus sp. Pnk-1]RYM38336.1 acetyl-CoA carboxylase biotin carboxyl carrier protein [Meiothermus sp. PNK-Is4]